MHAIWLGRETGQSESAGWLGQETGQSESAGWLGQETGQSGKQSRDVSQDVAQWPRADFCLGRGVV
jgi:hypothetical protein